MSTTWTITRQTLAESFRQRTAMFLIVVLGVIMLGMPFAARGDNSLSGAVQSFLSYSMTVLGFILSCATIFLAKTISDDLTGKHIQVLMTKPVARWQYVVGKWLGIVLLNLLVLAIAGALIYAMTMYIAGQRRGLYLAGGVLLLLGVLIAFGIVRVLRPVKYSLGRWVWIGVLCLVSISAPIFATWAMARYQNTLKPRDNYDEERLANQVLQARHASQFDIPNDTFVSETNALYERNLEQGKYGEDHNKDAIKKTLHDEISRRWRMVLPSETRVLEFKDIRCDRSKDTLLHLSYRLRIYSPPPDEIFRCSWVIGDPRKGAKQYFMNRRDVADRRHTLAFPADAVAEDGTLLAALVNANPWVEMGEPQAMNVVMFEGNDAVEVLFSVSSFGSNLIRALLLVACRLAFVAAIAVMLATLFSFPVACLVAFSAYLIGAIPNFLADSIDWMPDTGFFKYFTNALRIAIWAIHTIFIPKFSLYDGVGNLVEGRNVTLMWVLMGIGRLVLIQTSVLLLAACLLFRRREVSEVSV